MTGEELLELSYYRVGAVDEHESDMVSS